MTNLSAADAIRLGTQQVDAIYAGAEKIWPTWTVAKIPGLTVWVDASQLGLADGAAVSPWPDLSGGNHHGVVVATPPPKLRTNALNGKSVVRFKPNEGRIRGDTGFTGPLGNYNFTLLYVGRMVGPTVGRIFAGTYPGVNFLVGYHTSAYESCYDNSWVNPGVPWPALPTPWRMWGYAASHDGTNYSGTFYKNGVASGSVAGGIGLGAGWNLSGYDATGDQETCDGEVAELLIYNRKLSDTERQQVEDYLKTKWGL